AFKELHQKIVLTMIKDWIKKRKEQSEDADDNEQENENACTHKKPRLVWGEELRSKFEAAVYQLGLD
ncbi:hypothetical protein S245_059297, partial [Arachis hypogaea]